MVGNKLDTRSLGKPVDGPISRHINRRISTRITKFIVVKNIPLTPDVVSLISFLLAVASGLAFFKAHPILGGILAQVSSIIDGVDGELARARNATTRRGGFLDTMLDRFADIVICLGMALYLINSSSAGLLEYIISIFAITGSILPAYLTAEANARNINVDILVPQYRPPASRDVRLFIIFLGGITGFILPSLALIALITYINTAMKVCFIYFRLKE